MLFNRIQIKKALGWILFSILFATVFSSCKKDNSVKAVMENRYPKNPKVLFEKNDKESYIKITNGAPSNVFAIWTKIESRKGEYRVANGDLQFIFETIYGWDNPRIFIESNNDKIYKVTFSPEDPNALSIVASQLGLHAIEKNKEILALTIRVSPDGHKLKAKTINHDVTRRFYETGRVVWYCDANGDWPLDCISMKQLAIFLESRYRKPVVDLTELEGFWTLRLPDKSGKVYPHIYDNPMPLGDTGLELKWEKVNASVLVIEDI